jgi:hypothetical protein
MKIFSFVFFRKFLSGLAVVGFSIALLMVKLRRSSTCLRAAEDLDG